MKYTAADWMFDQLWNLPKDKFVWNAVLKQAKKIEKEQIKKAYWLGQINYRSEKDAEQYYQENYEEK